MLEGRHKHIIPLKENNIHEVEEVTYYLLITETIITIIV